MKIGVDIRSSFSLNGIPTKLLRFIWWAGWDLIPTSPMICSQVSLLKRPAFISLAPTTRLELVHRTLEVLALPFELCERKLSETQ